MAKDSRLYARFDLNMPEHPKVMLLSDAAFRALIESTMYSRRQLTDGFIDARIAIAKWGDAIANELSSNDPIKPSWAKVDGGYQLHDFAEHQITTADIQAKREAGRLGGLAKASKAVAPASEVLEHLPSTTLAKTETETELKRTSSSPSATSMEFDQFWEAYPKKVGKQLAIKAYAKALKATTPQKILDGVQGLIGQKLETKFIPHPTSWLNAGRWEDELEPTKPSSPSPWDRKGIH